jgi:hypothetical protein
VKSRQPKLSATGSELERYYRLEPEQVDDPVRWWIDHSNAFPRLSRFALDVLAMRNRPKGSRGTCYVAATILV